MKSKKKSKHSKNDKNNKNNKNDKNDKNNKKANNKRYSKLKVKSKKKYDQINDFFKTNARLSPTQRKYCHCLMNVRKTIKKGSPYPICISFLKKKKLLDFNISSNKYNYKKSKKEYQKMNPKLTHCLMNYDLYKYDLKQIQHLAKEKKIDIYYIPKAKTRTKSKNKNKKSNTSKTKKSSNKKYYTKNTLISKIIDNYLIKSKKKKI